MGASPGRTLGATASPGDDERAAEERCFLYRVLEADRPFSPPARYALANTAEVAIGRGERTGAGRDGKRLALSVADRWMSSRHAELRASFGRWLLIDAGAKNGCFVGGERTSRHELQDGDLIELGHTFFLFRRQVAAATDGDLDGAALPEPGFATLSPPLGAELGKLAQLAATPVSLLLLGESGTGKEVLARALHQRSGRAGAFVAVNCAAIPESLIESELFGHKKGAFSGATSDHLGLVRAADRGTLFLDEIGDLPAPSQAALLRVLQEREVRPVGATRSVPVDLRLISATHQDLDAHVAADRFRRDLYARIAGFRFRLPTLAERREDLGLVAAALLRRAAADAASAPRFDEEAARAVLMHDWPLNVRELDNCLTAAMHLAGDGPIERSHLPADLGQERRAASAGADDDSRQRDELVALLRAHGGNISAVARAAGKDRKQIQRWLKRYELDAAAFRR